MSRGRVGEYAAGRRIPVTALALGAFADGLGMPPAARRALGLAPGAPG